MAVIRLVWTVGRLPVSLIAGSVVIFLALRTNPLGWERALFHGIVIVLVSMIAYTINDLIDRRKDRERETPDKPISLGQVSVSQSRVFLVFLLLATVSLSCVVNEGNSFLIVSASLAGAYFYSIVGLKWPIFKNIAAAVLACAPLAYGAEVTAVLVPATIYVPFFIFVFGRELLMDVTELPGDIKAGLRTLASYIRPSLGRAAGWSTMFFGSLCLVLYSNNVARTGFILAGISLFGAALIALRNELNGILWTRLSLLVGSFSAALSITELSVN